MQSGTQARKYRLHTVLSHQFLGQLPERLRQAVFGNVARFISFRVGAEDAPLIAKELGIHSPEAVTDLAAPIRGRGEGQHLA